MTTLPATATTGPAHGRPELASLALSLQAWTIEAGEALAIAAGNALAAIEDAAEHVRAQLAPVARSGDERDAWAKAMDERLRRLAVKVSPGMSVAQGAPWREVMVDALSDLPAMVALTAGKRALHRRMQYMNEIEGVVRDIAAQVIAQRHVALERLRLLSIQIAQADMPRLPNPKAQPLTPAEIAALSPHLRAMGLKCGSISQADIDAADLAHPRQEIAADAVETLPDDAKPISASLFDQAA